MEAALLREDPEIRFVEDSERGTVGHDVDRVLAGTPARGAPVADVGERGTHGVDDPFTDPEQRLVVHVTVPTHRPSQTLSVTPAASERRAPNR